MVTSQEVIHLSKKLNFTRAPPCGRIFVLYFFVGLHQRVPFASHLVLHKGLLEMVAQLASDILPQQLLGPPGQLQESLVDDK